MARTRTPAPTDATSSLPERIIDVDVNDEMRTSFLEYAYSVIYARAIPDARDGLKPVQRRILYQMRQMGLRPERGYVKSARVVGEVMGRLHPHGDSAIYDTLVRLAQSWVMRVPLVDGNGNFGNQDDGPAAYRYTEARLDAAAMALVDSLDEDVVDMVPNYDGRELQPEVLPAAFPNLLVNGATGIAVGMATNMPPHNLREVVDAACHLLDRPGATVEDLMRHVPGPDFPTGGVVVGLEGVREAYRTGRGSFRTRAKATVEQLTPRRKGIVVTELPYNVGPERVRDRIADLVRSKKLAGVAAIEDHTDLNNGLRLIIEVKSGFNAEALLEELYRLTPLEDNFAINNVALVDGQPRTLGLRELLQVYLDHRIEVLGRRTRYRLAKHRDRLHLVEGLLLALLDIDEVIAVIRGSDDAAAARTRLMGVFDLTEVQATYILDMPLRRLTKYDRITLETERETLAAKIAELQELLDSPTALRARVAEELRATAAEFGTPRRTVLLESAPTPAATGERVVQPLEVPDEDCWVVLSSTGRIARAAGGIAPAQTGRRAAHDAVVSMVRARTRGEIAAVTTHGRAVRVPVIDLPALPPSANGPSLSGGTEVAVFLGAERAPDEQVLALMRIDRGADEPGGLLLATRDGTVKRVTPDVPPTKDVWEVIRLAEAGTPRADRVVGAVDLDDDTADIVFVATDGQVLRCPVASVRPQGRAGGGVAGINLRPGATVLGVGVVPADGAGVVVTVAGSDDALPGTQTGTVKVSLAADFPRQGRAGQGVRGHRFLKGETRLILGFAGPGSARAADAQGAPIELPAAGMRRDGSGVPGGGVIAAVAATLGDGAGAGAGDAVAIAAGAAAEAESGGEGADAARAAGRARTTPPRGVAMPAPGPVAPSAASEDVLFDD